MADYEMWLIVGSSQNWGRADNFREALGNAVKEAGMSYPMTQAHVYKLSSDTQLTTEDLWCDEMGTVHYSTKEGVTMKKLPRLDIPKKVSEAFYAFDLEAEELQWGPVDNAGLND